MKRSFFFLALLLSVVLVQAQSKLPFVVKQLVFKKDSFNIVKFGAIAEGLTLNTASINKAIDECSKRGGGVWLFLPVSGSRVPWC